MTVTIYHNPRCSNSRGALDLIREAGVEPVIVDYLAAPPTRDELEAMIAAAGLTVREAMRPKEAPYVELNLAQANDAQLLDAIVAHPVLLNRPFVVTAKGTRLCRPPDVVREIL
jgi:arsenate reductase